ncbi:Hypothetical protein HVR_LOCUS1246 [uncultured virus]|nr:Hypothetical protein HVR_LOCUS1246 [uncultured virus]
MLGIFVVSIEGKDTQGNYYRPGINIFTDMPDAANAIKRYIHDGDWATLFPNLCDHSEESKLRACNKIVENGGIKINDYLWIHVLTRSINQRYLIDYDEEWNLSEWCPDWNLKFTGDDSEEEENEEENEPEEQCKTPAQDTTQLLTVCQFGSEGYLRVMKHNFIIRQTNGHAEVIGKVVSPTSEEIVSLTNEEVEIAHSIELEYNPIE